MKKLFSAAATLLLLPLSAQSLPGVWNPDRGYAEIDWFRIEK